MTFMAVVPSSQVGPRRPHVVEVLQAGAPPAPAGRPRSEDVGGARLPTGPPIFFPKAALRLRGLPGPGHLRPERYIRRRSCGELGPVIFGLTFGTKLGNILPRRRPDERKAR